MKDRRFKLTATDVTAIKNDDSNYINQKGADLYVEGTYKDAVEYYRVASAMGNDNAISNLGYCYLYGRDIEPNLSLALAYFEIAAKKQNVEAAYKLGDIYGSDKWGIKDKELSIYYYRMAASYLIDEDWSGYSISYTDSLDNYPSLCYALGRELMPSGDMATDLDQAYQFLKHAEIGYKRELDNGASFYEKTYAGVLELLQDKVFDNIRKKYDPIFDDEELIDD